MQFFCHAAQKVGLIVAEMIDRLRDDVFLQILVRGREKSFGRQEFRDFRKPWEIPTLVPIMPPVERACILAGIAAANPLADLLER